MRSRIISLATFPTLLLFVVVLWAGAREVAQQPASVPKAKSHQQPASAPAHPAVLVQLMRGIMFPNSNVLFAATNKNPADIPPAKIPSAATDPLEGTFGQWQAAENSSLAIVEAASLLTVPRRLCSNDRPVPTTNADWPKLVQGLRNAGMQCYRAAQSKNMDKLSDATDVLTTACSNCHAKYRDTAKLADRCR
ncbi:MAG: hypothetical protein WA708_14720 [Acidobacteriaceae bacterium]